MRAKISVSARSVRAFEDAKPVVLAALMYVLEKREVKIVETSTSCAIELPVNQAHRAFKLLLDYFSRKDRAVQMQLTILLEAKNENASQRLA